MEQVQAFLNKVVGFLGDIPEMVRTAYEADPERFSYVVGGTILFLALLGIKEIYDVIFKNNKGALKKRVRELEQEKNDIGKKYLDLRQRFDSSEDMVHSLQERIQLLQSGAFQEIFTPEIVSGIVNQDKKVVQLAEDNFQFTQALSKLGMSPEQIQALRDKHTPELDEKEKAQDTVDKFLSTKLPGS